MDEFKPRVGSPRRGSRAGRGAEVADRSRAIDLWDSTGSKQVARKSARTRHVESRYARLVFALVPCGACSRHVKSSEASCPFCGAAAPASSSPSGAASSSPSGAAYSRLAAVAAVAASVAALTSCRSSTTGTPPLDAGINANAAPPYGAVPFDFECTSAAACLPGQVCCYKGSLTSQCQAGPCPVDGGLVQLCAMSAECGPGETCGTPSQPLPMSGLQACNPSPDGGADDASPVDAGDAGDGADGGESPGTTNADASD